MPLLPVVDGKGAARNKADSSTHSNISNEVNDNEYQIYVYSNSKDNNKPKQSNNKFKQQKSKQPEQPQPQAQTDRGSLKALSSISRHLTSIHEDEFEETLHEDADTDLDLDLDLTQDFHIPAGSRRGNTIMSKFAIPRAFGRKDHERMDRSSSSRGGAGLINQNKHFYDKAFMVDDVEHDNSDVVEIDMNDGDNDNGHNHNNGHQNGNGNDRTIIEQGQELVSPDVLHIRDRGLTRAETRARRTICFTSVLGVILLCTGIVVNQYQNSDDGKVFGIDLSRPFTHGNNNSNSNSNASGNKQKMDLLCDLDIITATPQGRQACQDACAVASCCHTTTNNYQDNCYADFKLFCSEFTACNLLKDGTPDIPTLNNANASADSTANGDGDGDGSFILEPAPGHLSDICHPENIKASSATVEECQEACEPAKCCFPSFGKLNPDMGSCYNVIDTIEENGDDIEVDNISTCQQYRDCEHIYHEPVGLAGGAGGGDDNDNHNVNDNNVDRTSSPVYEACAVGKISTDEAAKQICVELCHSFQCCFVSLPTIGLCDSDPGCAGWGAPCEVLYKTTSSGDRNNNSNKDMHVTVTNTREPDTNPEDHYDLELLREIKLACTPNVRSNAISTLMVLDECETLCAPSLCCFIEHQFNGGCQDEVWCDRYLDCQILTNTPVDIPDDDPKMSPNENVNTIQQVDEVLHTDEK
jgi:hypothetical protein